MLKVANHGTPLDADARATLQKLVTSIGEYAAADALGIGRQTLARALAGLGMRAGSNVQIRDGLARIGGRK